MMSNIIPPLVNDSPPPIEDCPNPEEEDDDGFGDFSIASDSAACELESSAPSPIKLPSLDINFNIAICDLKLDHDPLDRRKSDKEILNIPTELIASSDEPSVHQLELLEDNVEVTADSDNDFGDFESTPVEKIDDDFAEFDSSIACSSLDSGILLLNPDELYDKAKEVFQSVFSNHVLVADADFINPYDINSDSIFNQLKDVRETPALKFRWAKSTARKYFLKALNIDERNIISNAAWNKGDLPKFASNLAEIPLEPIKSEASTSRARESSQLNMHSDALTSPKWSLNDSSSHKEPHLQSDTVSVSTKVPTVQARNSPEENNSLQTTGETIFKKMKKIPPRKLAVKDHSHKEENRITKEEDFVAPPILIPLRETHIDAVSDVLMSDWLSNNDSIQRNSSNIQTSLESKEQKDSDKIESTEVVVELDDDFSEFHSSSVCCVEPLQPMKSTVIENPMPRIDWPEPGISDDDALKCIEFHYSSKLPLVSSPSTTTQQSTKTLSKTSDSSIPKTTPSALTKNDQTAWGDFVKPPTSLSTPTKSVPLSLSVHTLQQMQSVCNKKSAIPLVTANGVRHMADSNQHLSGTHSLRSTPTTSPIHRPHTFQNCGPSTITEQFEQSARSFNSASSMGDDDDWSEFVSAPPQIPMNHSNNHQTQWTQWISAPSIGGSGNARKMSTGIPTNIIANPGHFVMDGLIPSGKPSTGSYQQKLLADEVGSGNRFKK